MKFRAILTFAKAKVDRSLGLITGVAVITAGAARGHGMLIDGKTIDTVLSCAQKYESGVKVKFNPATFNHGEGGIAGLLIKESWKKDGETLRADLQLEKNYPYREYIMDLAEGQPDQFGLSIDFDCKPEEINGLNFARCNELFAATIVDQPAANPTGLFAVGDDGKTKLTANKEDDNTMPFTKEEMMSMLAEANKGTADALAALGKRMDGFEAKLNTPAVSLAEVSEDEKKEAGFAEGDTDEQKLKKLTAYREGLDKPVTGRQLRGLFTGFVREVGAHGPASASSAATNNGSAKVHPFAALVKKHKDSGARTLGLAMQRARQDDPKAYNDYQTKLDAREIQPVSFD